jgi:PAS domain S-box-containing protein
MHPDTRFRELADSIPQIVWISEPTGVTSFLNRQYYVYTGLSEDIPGPEGWDLVVHPDDKPEAYRKYALSQEIGDIWECELRLKSAQGEYRWHLSRSVPIKDATGKVVQWVATSTDIHKQKTAEASLLESQEFNRRIAEAMPSFLYVKDLRQRKNLHWNDRLAQMLGYEPDELRQKDSKALQEMVHPDDLHMMRKEHWAPGESLRLEYRMRHSNGEYRWIEDNAVVFRLDEEGEPTQVLGIAQDITERKRSEQSIRELEERQKLTLDAARIGTWDIDFASGSVSLHNNVEILFGIAKGSATSFDELAVAIHPQDRPEVRDAVDSFTKRLLPLETEFRVLWPDGSMRWLSCKGTILTDGASPTRLAVVTMDITDRRKAEQALRLSEERSLFLLHLSDLIRNVGDPAEVLRITVNATGQYLHVNRCTYVELDVENDTVVLWDSYSRDVPDTRGQFKLSDFAGTIKAMNDGKTLVYNDVAADNKPEVQRDAFERVQVRSGIAVPIRKDGELIAVFGVNCRTPRIWTEFEVALVEEVADRTWLALQSARAEEQVRRLNAELESRVEERTSELWSTVRELEGFAYTVSHDLRAPLRAINATSRMLQDDYGNALPAEAKQYLTIQAEAANKMGMLIDQLLRYARIAREEINCEKVDLSQIAEEIITDLNAAGVRPGLQFKIEPNLVANGDPKLLQLVLHNLLENSVKFSPQGGTVQLGVDASGFFVQDQGIGFDMEFEDKLWRPFTRLVKDEDYPGTGIGLANVQRIIERHGGRIWAESTPGKGAKFTFLLPD